jgi:uncharacterized membrane protein
MGKDRILGAVSYLWILFLVPLVFYNKNKFAKFHAKQGLVLFLFEFLAVLVGWIPFLGWFASMILGTAFAILSFIGVISALAGEKYKLPFIGKYAQKIKF